MDILNRFIIPFKNRVRYSRVFRNLVTRMLVNPEFPSVIGADPTNRCNLKCAFCGPITMKSSKGTMGVDLFQKLVEECKSHKRLWMLILHNFGEPLMNENLPRMVALAKQAKIARSVQFSTNGTLLTEEKAGALIEAGLDGLVFSVDALTREEYRELKGGDFYGRVVENARMIMRLKKSLKRGNPFVSAKMVLRRGQERAFRAFKAMWKPIVDEVALTAYTNWGNRVADRSAKPLPEKRYACHFLWYYPVVNWDGKVFFCCATCDEDAIIGDLKTSGLAEIWKEERLRRVREAHLRGEFDTVRPCKACIYWAESGVNLDRYLRKKTK
jgi:radical SAM protein with 4Fe4S-binding SPASM domain